MDSFHCFFAMALLMLPYLKMEQSKPSAKMAIINLEEHEILPLGKSFLSRSARLQLPDKINGATKIQSKESFEALEIQKDPKLYKEIFKHDIFLETLLPIHYHIMDF